MKQKYNINTGEIYTSEQHIFKDSIELRALIDEMETNLLYLLRSNKVIALTSESHSIEYFETKILKLEDRQYKVLSGETTPFTFNRIDSSRKENGSRDYFLYEFSHPYILYRNPEESDYFDFFFAFKLHQLDLLEIDSFLEYHLLENFNNNFESFKRVLLVLLRKYKKILFNKNIIATVKEWLSQKPKIVSSHDIYEKIEWNGTQKELAELFIQLKNKGWIKKINSITISNCFSKAATISQVLKPGTSKIQSSEGLKLIDHYDQVYTKRYREKFSDIKKR